MPVAMLLGETRLCPPGLRMPSSDLLSSDAAAGSPGTRERLTEPPASTGPLTVEQSDGGRVVRRVVLAGSRSRNGYKYRSEALQEAVALYESKPVFLDHAADLSQPRRRSARDLVGTLTNVAFESTDEGGKLRGDVRVLDTESGRTFLALCEAEGSGVGMSHVVLARRSTDGAYVESIEQVISVDAVAFPATTTNFHEQVVPTAASSTQSGKSLEAPADTSGHLSVPDHHDGDSVAQIASEREQLRQQIAELEDQLGRQRRGQRRDLLLSQSGLPEAAISETFRRLVRLAPSDEAAQTLIEDRRWLLAQPPAGPHSESRTGNASDDLAAFVAAIRRR